jgi:CheY-like chemotaxis protein
MVAADDLPVAQIWQKYLESQGAGTTVVLAADDVLALCRDAAAKGHPYDVVLIDSQLDGGTTLDLGTNLLHDRSFGGVRPVLVASRAQRSTRPEAIRRGFVRTITKPLRRDSLGPAVAAVVGRDPSGAAAAAEQGAAVLCDWAPPPTDEALAAGALILVAEDNPTNQLVMKKLMARLGYAIDMAANGAEALDKYLQRPYGLLIADCHMPEMDGYELTTRIRAEEQGGDAHLPIIALTGDALAGAAQYCFDVGMDDYLSKPVSIDLLDATIQRWLPGAAALRRPRVVIRQDAVAKG